MSVETEKRTITWDRFLSLGGDAWAIDLEPEDRRHDPAYHEPLRLARNASNDEVCFEHEAAEGGYTVWFRADDNRTIETDGFSALPVDTDGLRWSVTFLAAVALP